MVRFARYFVAGVFALTTAAAACGGSHVFSGPGASGNFEGGIEDGGTGSTYDGNADVPVLGIGPYDAAPPCVNLACQQQACAGGGTTSVSGTVYAPNGTLPLYNVIVYVPNAPLQPIDAGISCDQCGTIASGDPIATALSDATGHFTLTNVPSGANIPLVVQLGKWRRQTTIPMVNPCVDNPLTNPDDAGASLTRLPRNQQEGSMPHIALTTGGCDSMGCMLGKLGIDPAEFGVQSDGPSKAINVYSSNSGGFADGLSNTTQASALWSSLPLLSTYDMGIFSCECSEGSDSKGSYGSPDFQVVTNYLDQGGRIFTTDFQYTWYRYSPDPNLGAASSSDLNDTGIGVIPGGAPPDNSSVLLPNETFPKGLALAQWLTTVYPSNPLVGPDGGPLSPTQTADGVSCPVVFDNLTSINTKPQMWATSDDTPGPRVLTVNTPAGLPVAQQCGKGVHIDAHITSSSSGEPDFVGCNGSSGPVGSAGCYPSTCTNPLQEDEAMFAFFFFDLASCIQNEGQPPVPPPPQAK